MNFVAIQIIVDHLNRIILNGAKARRMRLEK